jgi:ABC-type lipoprotein release transport system permease subunit
MIWSVAWKNIWRNKTRSLIILVAISLGLLAGIFSVGFMMGMVEQRISNSIHNELSHVQIHNPEFLKNDEIDFTIKHADDVISTINSYQEVKAVAKRIKINAMANTSGNNVGVTVYGVHPEQEEAVFDISENIIEESGSYLNGDSKNKIVIGEELAEQLNIIQFKITDETLKELPEAEVPEKVVAELDSLKDELFRSENDFEDALVQLLGKNKKQKFYSRIKEHSKVYRSRSKIVLTMQDADGNLTGGAFRIAGIYSISNSAYETMNAFVRFDDLARITNIDSSKVHEIGVLLNEREQAPQVVQKLKSEFPEHSVRIWKEIQPDLAVTTQYVEISYYIIIIFILLALGFGIVNTMLMAVLERIKELGMLMAIGMNRKRVFLMIMLETVYLTLSGALVGMILGYLLIEITGSVGIDLSMYAEGFSAIGYSTLIYPEITFAFFIGVAGLVIATGILSSVYPAIKALKLNPVEATRTE